MLTKEFPNLIFGDSVVEPVAFLWLVGALPLSHLSPYPLKEIQIKIKDWKMLAKNEDSDDE